MALLNSVQEIKQAVEAGKTVYAGSTAYRVIKDSIGQWLIKCDLNDDCVGLTNVSGERLNMDSFFTNDEPKQNSL